MRHLIAGSFKSYFTMVVNGGFMRDPIVPYSLITKRSVCGPPSGYGGAAPRPRPPGGSGRVHTEPDPAISSGGAPDGTGPAPRPRPGPGIAVRYLMRMSV